MAGVFIVADGRTLGAGIHAHQPGDTIPIAAVTNTDPETGAVLTFSMSEARSLVRTGFGRIVGVDADAPPALPAGTLVTGPARIPVRMPIPVNATPPAEGAGEPPAPAAEPTKEA